MFEFLEGVSAQRIKGSPPFQASGVLEGRVRLIFQKSNDTAIVVLNGNSFSVSPSDLPPGFELKSPVPPYEVEFKVAGNVEIKGNAEVDALIYYVANPDKFRASLMHLFGSDDMLKALGVIGTEINNLKPVPAVVRVRW